MNVAAYCRVSTDDYDQINSFESQKKYFEEFILKNEDWDLVDIYADEGVTGTNTSKRVNFNRMIEDAYKGKIDLILTKEVSRFARNTVDTLEYTRQLKKRSIYVIFTNDNIDTRQNDSEFRLTIMASVAQEESRKTSERVKWGVKRKMENGFCYSGSLIGYDVSKGVMSINKDGAKTVKRIFDMFLNENATANQIARTLNREQIPTPRNAPKWFSSTVTRILRNEKYVGDLIQHKSYVKDYLDHKCVKNDVENYVSIYNHHEGIVSRDEWNRVQDILKQSTYANKPHKVSNSYWDSGKIFCGVCNSRFTPKRKQLKDSCSVGWRCVEALKNGSPHKGINNTVIGCKNIQLNEKAIRLILSYVFKQLVDCKQDIENDLLAKISDLKDDKSSRQLQIKNLNDEIQKTTDKIKRLVDLYLDGIITKEDIKKKKFDFNKHISMCKEKIEELNNPQKNIADAESKFETIRKRILQIISKDDYDQSLYQNMVDKIIVYPENVLHIYIKDVENPFKVSFKIQGKAENYHVFCDFLT